MGEIFGKVLKHVAVAESSVVVCTLQSISNIICDVAHAVAHNNCTQ